MTPVNPTPQLGSAPQHTLTQRGQAAADADDLITAAGGGTAVRARHHDNREEANR